MKFNIPKNHHFRHSYKKRQNRPAPASTSTQARTPRSEASNRARERSEKKIPVVARDVSGRFQKGSSGNPAGSKLIVPEEVRSLARSLSVEAILRLAHWMRSADSMASIAATKIILDRGLGKAIQPIASPNGGALVNITVGTEPVRTTEELQAVYAAMMRDPGLDVSALRIELEPSRQARAQPIEHQPKGSGADAAISAHTSLQEESE
jgi:hypothetical protein